MARGNGASAINAILDIRAGQLPTYLVNRQLRTPEFERKLENRASRRSPRPRTPLTPIQVG
jgi:hypothetical protein